MTAETQLRDELIALAWDDEHSDLPTKIFRFHSRDDEDNFASVFIKTKTKLGAVISSADHFNFWDQFVKDREEDDINRYADELVEMVFNDEHDNYLQKTKVDVIILTPFSEGMTKSARKK